MGGNDTLSVKERFAAMEKHWKKKRRPVSNAY